MAALMTCWRKMPRWAWSAGVNHAVVVDAHARKALWLRVDQPEVVRDHPVRTPEDAQELLEKLEVDEPGVAGTAIALAIDAFRSLRLEINDRNGNDLDAILAFNVLLLWADLVRQAGGGSRSTLAAAVERLGQGERFRYSIGDFSPGLGDFPVGDYAEQLLDQHGGLLLDPYLLLRHASGTLFQEAHIELERPATARQGKLFPVIYANMAPPAGQARRDARYTPANLARLLAESALKRFRELNPGTRSVEILDPACGSGVFLDRGRPLLAEHPRHYAARSR